MNDNWNITWEAILVVEDEVSPAGWYAAPGSITLPATPMPLTDINGSVIGRIDEVWRDGNKIMGRGVRCGPEESLNHSVDVAVNKSEFNVLADGEIRGVVVLPKAWQP